MHKKKKLKSVKPLPKKRGTGTEIQPASPAAAILTSVFALNFIEGFGCRNREKSSQTGPVSEILPAILGCRQGTGPLLRPGEAGRAETAPAPFASRTLHVSPPPVTFAGLRVAAHDVQGVCGVAAEVSHETPAHALLLGRHHAGGRSAAARPPSPGREEMAR